MSWEEAQISRVRIAVTQRTQVWGKLGEIGKNSLWRSLTDWTLLISKLNSIFSRSNLPGNAENVLFLSAGAPRRIVMVQR